MKTRPEGRMKKHTKALCRVLDTLDTVKMGAEVGVWRGNNSGWLLHRYQKLRLMMIDRWTPFTPNESRVDKVMGEMTQKDFDKAFLEALGNTQFAFDRRAVVVGDNRIASEFVRDETLDFVFIDAAHDYDNVRRDIDCWKGKVRRGGVLSGHDYGSRWFGVTEAVDETFDADRISFTRGSKIWWVVM